MPYRPSSRSPAPLAESVAPPSEKGTCFCCKSASVVLEVKTAKMPRPLGQGRRSAGGTSGYTEDSYKIKRSLCSVNFYIFDVVVPSRPQRRTRWMRNRRRPAFCNVSWKCTVGIVSPSFLFNLASFLAVGEAPLGSHRATFSSSVSCCCCCCCCCCLGGNFVGLWMNLSCPCVLAVANIKK